MKKLLIGISLFFALAVHAADKITASITVTNMTTNGMTFTVNSSVRTFTNNVVTSSSQVLTNNDVTGCGSKTNLFKQIGLNLFSQTTLIDTGTNTFQLVGTCAGALTVSASAGLASVSYSTQTCASATPVGVPFASYYPAVASRTNTASQLVTDLNNYDTNSINQNAALANQLLGTNKDSVASGKLTLNNTNNQIYGIISSLGISGNSVRLTNGLYLTPIFLNPAMTNGVNYGGAFSSKGTNGSGSEQFGLNAIANNDGSLAVGYGAHATGETSTAIGYQSLASLDGDVAFGINANAGGGGSIALGSAAVSISSGSAFGSGAIAYTNATALGASASATFNNSTAVGYQATTTAANQVMLGAAGISAVVQNNLAVQGSETITSNLTVTGNAAILGVQTNGAHLGTNNFLANSDIAFTKLAISSFANGNNSGVVIGTNVFAECSGPTGAFAINGIAGGRDGKIIILYNGTGQDCTFANQSGVDPVAANRIICMTGADETTTGNGAAILIYSGSSSRWILISLKQ
jgi:hypothetical protein